MNLVRIKPEHEEKIQLGLDNCFERSRSSFISWHTTHGSCFPLLREIESNPFEALGESSNSSPLLLRAVRPSRGTLIFLKTLLPIKISCEKFTLLKLIIDNCVKYS